jgi:hypothetical protein
MEGGGWENSMLQLFSTLATQNSRDVSQVPCPLPLHTSKFFSADRLHCTYSNMLAKSSALVKIHSYCAYFFAM